MKIKLLAVPSIIVLIIVLSIWVVYPAYSNGATGVMDNYNKLKSEQVKLNSLQGKSGNAGKLSSQLENMSSGNDVLYEFIPVDMKENEILDNLNKMASDSGLLVYSVSIKQPQPDAATIDEPSATSADPSDPTASMLVSAPLSVAKSFETDVEVSGNYTQIKDFLNKMNGFVRHSSLVSFSLKKQSLVAADGTAPVVSNTLAASIILDFDVMKKAMLSDGNVDDPVFSDGNLDTDIITKIKNQYNVAALTLDTGQKGKSDIFMP